MSLEARDDDPEGLRLADGSRGSPGEKRLWRRLKVSIHVGHGLFAVVQFLLALSIVVGNHLRESPDTPERSRAREEDLRRRLGEVAQARSGADRCLTEAAGCEEAGDSDRAIALIEEGIAYGPDDITAA